MSQIGNKIIITAALSGNLIIRWVKASAPLAEVGSNDANHGWAVMYAYDDSGTLLIEVDFYDKDFASTTLSAIVGTNTFFLPEIRVYP